MIKYLKISNFEDVENRVLSDLDGEYITDGFTYYFKQVGDCGGIFRTARRTKRGHLKGEEELVAYYHEGEF